MATDDQTQAILSQMRREVWIVTSAAGDQRGGLVATWVNQASVDPEAPLMMIGIAPNHFTADLIDRSGSFGLHLITKEQLPLVWRFGGLAVWLAPVGFAGGGPASFRGIRQPA